MNMLYPLLFRPIYKERPWGGGNLSRLYGRVLPPSGPIGESWEISDRPGDSSVLANGVFAGRDLRWLMEEFAGEILGEVAALNGRFPLLFKILDAKENLSVQVHPPAAVAATIGGESKTEFWFIADARESALLFAGLKQGVTRSDFERGLAEGTVDRFLHQIGVCSGDAFHLPSGRVHAIGSGIVLFEVQENSDTTYRVFDWNRPGTDGRPRQLQIAEALRCIDFRDFEPALVARRTIDSGVSCILVEDPHFCVSERILPVGRTSVVTDRRPVVITVVTGAVVVSSPVESVSLHAGDFCLVPAELGQFELNCAVSGKILWTVPGLGLAKQTG